ncbi:hypothetical protein MXD81_57145, partial [Microbacteriaceae bacterium K1510]|nr:hypothetical protein [Microbacteriaceae bacterium K1510]
DLTRTIKERRLKHIGSAFLKVIERTAPYHGGNDGLRAIHDLNILDKHQALVPTISIVSVDWPVKIAQGSQQFVTGLTKDGQRLIVFPRAFCPLLPGSRIKANFSIIFGDVGIFRSTDVVKQLEACIVSVEAILKEFQAAGNERTAGSSQQLSQRDL